MIFAIIGAVICLSLAGLFIGFRVTKGGMLALYLKGFASLAFVVLGAIMFFVIAKVNWTAVFVVLGLVLGLVGDVLLDFKVVKKEQSDKFLNFGMLAFGLGHVSYFTYLALYLAEFNWFALIIALCTALLAVVVIVFELAPAMKLDFGKFRWQTIAYTFILSFVMVFSICLAIKEWVLWLMAGGLTLIFISDLILSTMYFGGKSDSKLLCILNHGIYYSGQILIAISCLLFII